ncbi:MAG: pseudouridine synthase [Sphingomonas adhaesiva]|uniref:pseudouridine synthase n=1 Tax=Sphingomonas adhaesiva TaxID=28212 RepID=UPI002FF560F6
MAETPPQHRIAKLLARAGVASRREVERMIVDGRVAKDGVVLDTPATVLPSLDGVTVDGDPVAAAEPTRLFLFHKPAGVLTAERDFSGRPTIYDRLPKDLPRLVPVGRLDLNTEGLLLLTTDGAFKRQLELPSTGVERTYRARAYGHVTQAHLEELIHGVEVEGVRYGQIDANLERRTGTNVWIEMTLREGKNREVRRVLEYLGLRVSRLIRTRYGPFVLGDLPVGGIGEVRDGDVAAFRQTLKTAPAVRERTPDVDVAATTRRQRSTMPSATRPAGSSRGAATPARAMPPRDPARQTRDTPRPARDPARPVRAPERPARSGAPSARADVRPMRGPAGTAAPARDGNARNDARRSAAPQPPRKTLTPATEPEAPTRREPIKRKAGWAKPKPRTGPAPRGGKRK